MNRVDELFDEIKNSDKRSKETIEIAEELSDIIFKLSDARIKKGLTQRQLADLCGIKQAAIARMESLKVIPRLDTVIRVAKCLDVQINVESSVSSVFDVCLILDPSKYSTQKKNLIWSSNSSDGQSYHYTKQEVPYAVFG